MGQSTTGGVAQDTRDSRSETQVLGGNGKLVVEQVEIVRRREVIKVPEIVIEQRPTIEYVPQVQQTVRYDVVPQETIRYDVREQETIKYNTVEQETVKYVPREVECEKPVLVNKSYERPVFVEKEYVIVTYQDIEALKELIDLAPKLLAQLKELKDYKLVEEVIKVPQVQYVPTQVERVVWIDRKRDKVTGELLDADTH
jgi:hypothetical protein